jgi:hypothetical protein
MSRKTFILGSFLLASSHLVQAAPTYRYAYLSFLEGELSVQRAAEPEPEPGSLNMPVLPGDRIWTHGDSRAEVRLNGASRLRLDKSTKVDFVDLDSETIVRLWNGASILKLTENEGPVRIDSPAGSIRPTMPGTYRVDVEEGSRVTLSVTHGAAELASTLGAVVVESGETSHVTSGEAPDAARSFNTAVLDEFDLWSDRRDQMATSVRNVGVRSVPYEVESYSSELSSYGDWTVDASYGSVWYPRVGAGWAPYQDGRWCYTRFGYTWASYEPWGWAPYHYGRWGYNPRGWYWIPGSVWSPAWVSFAVGPYWVGWSPLGFHNAAVFGFDSHFGHHGSRHHGGWRRGGHRGRSGWSFASRDQFRGDSGRVARLDDDLIRETASNARRFDGGAVLDRDLNPRGARERGDWQGSSRFAERRSGAVRGSAELRAGTSNRFETPTMPRAFASSRDDSRSTGAEARSTRERFAGGSRARASAPFVSSRSSGSGTPSGRSSAFGDRSGTERRSGVESPRANVIPPRGAGRGEPAPVQPSSRSMGRGRGGEADPGRRQSFERSSPPSERGRGQTFERSSPRSSSQWNQRQSFERSSPPERGRGQTFERSSPRSSPSQWSQRQSVGRSSSRSSTANGRAGMASPRGSRGSAGGGGFSARSSSGGGRSRSQRN